MSGNTGQNSTTIFPIPSVPLVDERGRITPAWYRVFVTLVQRSGGTGGRVTPLPPEPFQVGLFDVFGSTAGQDADVGAGLQLTLAGMETRTLDDLLFLGMQQAQKEQIVTFGFDLGKEVSFDQTFFLPALGVPADPDTITVGASPYAYAPGFDGFATVSGGTVTGITVSRDAGVTNVATGVIAGVFPLSLMDTLTITYTVAPTITFFRR